MREQLSINISVARSCFVRCNGCYNHFGKHENLVNTKTIISFLDYARSAGIDKVTLCGGDPLSRPDIITLLGQIKELEFYIKLDTVGTPIIADAETIFFGRNDVPRVDAALLASLVDLIGVPIDGTSNETVMAFRSGRKKLLEEQLCIIKILDEVRAKICINTVVHRQNIDDIANILPLIQDNRSVVKWQLFQFSPIGPLGFRNREIYTVDNYEFSSLRRKLTEIVLNNKFSGLVEFKANADRKGNYLLIDSEGLAWLPKSPINDSWDELNDASDQRFIVGDIKSANDHESIINTILYPRKVLSHLFDTSNQQSSIALSSSSS